METLSRSGLPPDLAAMQAYAGKLAGSSSLASLTSSKAYKDAAQMIPPEFGQALFAEMAAQMAAAQGGTSSSQSSSSKRRADQREQQQQREHREQRDQQREQQREKQRDREQEMKEAFDQLSKSQVELFARNLGMGSGISLIPTSSSAASMYSSILDEPKTKRSRISSSQQSHRDGLANLMAAAVADEKQLRALTRASRSSSSTAASLNTGTSNETTIEKVTLSPVAAASIAGLPPQTSITLAPSPSLQQHDKVSLSYLK